MAIAETVALLDYNKPPLEGSRVSWICHLCERRCSYVLRLGPWIVCRWCVDRARTADRRIKYGHHQLRNIR